MEIPDKCDVLVVGAGPAGAMAAIILADHKIDVILIDAKPRLGERPHCGEFIPKGILSEYEIDKECVRQSVQWMETLVNYQPLSDPIISPGFMIDRRTMDRNLARTAAVKGASVFSGAKFLRFENNHCVLNVAGKLHRLKAQLIIGADGANSAVASNLGLNKPGYLVGVQVEAPLKGPLTKTIVFFDHAFREGYGWLFPKKDAANVGIGMNPGQGFSPGTLLKDFTSKLVQMDLIKDGIIARTGGVIPVSGPRISLVHGNCLLCGDAGGLTHPITGAGIGPALFSGYSAGRAVVKFLVKREKSALDDYQQEILGKYGGIYKHAINKRTKLKTEWDTQDFKELCRNTWIGFKGYRKRERA